MCSWNETPSANITFLELCGWHCSPWMTSCWPHLEGERSTSQGLQFVSHLGSCTLPRSGSPAPTTLSAELNTTTVSRDFQVWPAESDFNPGWSFVLFSYAGTHLSQEEGTATHSSVLPWRIPWTEEPGRLQSMGSWLKQRSTHTSISRMKVLWILPDNTVFL